MAANEAELRALMRASLAGDAAAYRTLLSGLSANLRAYYTGRLARIGRSATEAEDLMQEALMAIHTPASHLRSGRAADAMGIRDCAL
jgi:RNA polymerase sigma-70 factor (ECF subfamily)